MFSIFKNLLSVPIEETKPKITINDLDIMDDVWIKEDGKIFKGWVWEKTRRHLTVVYDNAIKDYKFNLIRPLTKFTLEQDNKILYCNEPKNDRSS